MHETIFMPKTTGIIANTYFTFNAVTSNSI